MKIIIHPWARKLENGNENAKNYPYWEELVSLLYKYEYEVIQVGEIGEKQLVEDFRTNLGLKELKKLLHECDTFISIDSFFQHLAWSEDKKGFVIFSLSDPLIFGHDIHYNFIKREYLRKDQFYIWNDVSFIKEAFPLAEEIIEVLNKFYK